MTWIVLGEGDNGKIRLISKSGVSGLLPKGSYLTVQSDKSKHILRVDDSRQIEPYSPSALIADLNLEGLGADSACKNEVLAYRVYDISDRNDGLIDYIKPQQHARRSTQEEVDLAFSSGSLDHNSKRPRVFIAAMQSNQNFILSDDNGKYITAGLPESMFYHQMMVCGKTGSGKTASMKYLMQYFIEELGGAVLAVNLKDVDLLQMDRPTNMKTASDEAEWKSLGGSPHGIDNYIIYKPAGDMKNCQKGVVQSRCKEITLDVSTIDADSLTGLLQGISDLAALNLPSIFTYWREKNRDMGVKLKFSDFCKKFAESKDRVFPTLNDHGEELSVNLHKATFDNIVRSLNNASPYFDNEGVKVISADDVLTYGSLSVIDVTGKNGMQFGSILLRDLLAKIVKAKNMMLNDVPILIVIDEVHQFYGSNASREALGDLDTICRTGRTKKMGVVFASQNPADIPAGLSSVINTKIFFKTDMQIAKLTGVKVTADELEGLKPGFAVVSIQDLPQLKVIKFPLAYAGVVKNG